MKFEVSIPQTSDPTRVRKLTVEATNWFDALSKAIVQLQERLRIKNFLFSILDDGHSAQMIDPQTARSFEIKRVSSSVSPELPASATPPQAAASPISLQASASAVPPTPPQATSSPVSSTLLPTPAPSAGPSPAASVAAPAKQLLPQHSLDSLKLAPPAAKGPLPPPKPAPAASISSTTRTPMHSYPSPLEPAPPAPPSTPLPHHSLAPVSPSQEGIPAAPRSSPLLANRRPPTGSPPTLPASNPHDTFSTSGPYAPGKTNDFLTDAFMKLSALYDHFGNDRRTAIRYVLDLVSQGVACHGAAILLIDINDPSKEFWFGGVKGPDAERLEPLHIASNRGVIGFCAEHGVALNLPDLQRDPRSEDDAFLELQIDIGPVIYVPIQHQRRFQGILLAYRKAGQKAFVQGEMNILEYFASALGDYLVRD